MDNLQLQQNLNDQHVPEVYLRWRQHFYEITWLDTFCVPMSLLIFMADIISDIFVGVTFFFHQQWLYGSLTLTLCIICPIISTIQSYKYNKNQVWKKYSDKWYHWSWLPIYFFLNLEVIIMFRKNWFRARRYLNESNSLNTKEKTELLKKYQKTYKRISDAKEWETKLEAVPQLVFQLYVLAEEPHARMYRYHWYRVNKTFVALLKEELNTDWYQWVAVLTSLAGYASTQYSGGRADGILQKIRFSNKGCVILAFSRAIPLGCRAGAIALLMAVRPWWVIFPLILRYILSAVWGWHVLLRYKKERSFFLAAIEGYTWLIGPRHTFHVDRAIFYNVIYFCEDVFLLVLWGSSISTLTLKLLTLVAVLADAMGRMMFAYFSINLNKYTEIFQETKQFYRQV